MQLLLLSRKNCSPDTVIMKFSDPVLRRLTINMTNITKLTLEEKKKTYPVPPWTWGPSPRKKEFHLYLPKQVKSAGQRLMISLVVYPSLYLELKILHNQIHDKKSKKKKLVKLHLSVPMRTTNPQEILLYVSITKRVKQHMYI